MVPRKGAVVSAMTPKHVRDVYEMNILLIGQLCRRAASNWQEGELDPFYDLLQEMEQYVSNGSVMEYYDATFKFARMAYCFVDNPYLEDMLEDLQPAVRRTYYFAINLDRSELDRSLLFFRELMVSLLQRDPDGAEQKLAQFGQHQCDTVLKRLQAEGLMAV
jgi:DNA-binding GntR family transcriptional regulator